MHEYEFQTKVDARTTILSEILFQAKHLPKEKLKNKQAFKNRVA